MAGVIYSKCLDVAIEHCALLNIPALLVITDLIRIFLVKRPDSVRIGLLVRLWKYAVAAHIKCHANRGVICRSKFHQAP